MGYVCSDVHDIMSCAPLFSFSLSPFCYGWCGDVAVAVACGGNLVNGNGGNGDMR